MAKMTSTHREIESTMKILSDWDMLNGKTDREIQFIKSQLKSIASAAINDFGNHISVLKNETYHEFLK